MKTIPFLRLISVLLLWSLSSYAYAQQWYHVELIVFEQLNTYSDEAWPQTSFDINAPLSPSVSGKRIHPAKNSTLIQTAARLTQSRDYQVLYHKSWQQPIMRKASSQGVSIQSADGTINGSVRFFKSTYLHADLDLQLMQGAKSPRLIESRRIRSKKLYFYDHPKMGALLQITPL
ncbi:MAG: CsiV family protein [Methylophagaceae bacterium]